MLTYQDFLAAPDMALFVNQVIAQHTQSAQYLTAIDADAYDHQQNTAIMTFVSEVKKRKGSAWKQDIKIPCNLFRRVNKQRCSYLLGNGVSFTRKEKRVDGDGNIITVDLTREQLGRNFDGDVYDWGYKALIHGVAFGYWTPEHIYVYPLTKFAPLYDEETNALRAGVYFWRIDPSKPMFAELYTEQGIYSLRTDVGSNALKLTNPEPKPYLLKTRNSEARGLEIIGEENYSTLPVIPMYGSSLHQSTLVGIKARIDSIDFAASGFARDVRDIAKIYWILENCGAMTEEEMDRFLDDILQSHIAKVDSDSAFNGESAKQHLAPYVNDVPYNSSMAYINQATGALYQDFGALDVHEVSANSTNDHLDAAYQPLDEEADEFEREVTRAIKQGLALWGIDDEPKYLRNRIVNEKERNDMILASVNLIGRRKALEKLTFIDTDEVEEIERDEYADAQSRLTTDDDTDVA